MKMVKPLSFPLVCRISCTPTKMLHQFSNIPTVTRGRYVPIGCRNSVKDSNYSVLGIRCMSTSYERSKEPLPWLAKRERKKVGGSESSNKGVVKSSWEESAEKYLKGGSSTGEVDNTPKFERRTEFRKNEDDTRKFERRTEFRKNEDDTRKFVRRTEFRKNEDATRNFERRTEFRKNEEQELGDDYEEEDGEVETKPDPRWATIKNRFNRFYEAPDYDRPDVRKWNKQEDWGKKTWKEAKESTLPKIAGEGVYGVGPVLAALSTRRREFYALYVQDGLDLSTNNRKKKDKKGFERILKMAEKLGLSIKEVSKHDLNMIADNRPHQGLVLDASPLEMVGIKELEPVSSEEENSPLWLALDEVTDPQNLGAIIRSAYFFGASGVVLCAKNSAPLSGVVSKASAGSLELMEVRSCKNMMQFLTSSADNGWRVLGGSVSSRAVRLTKIVAGAPSILVLGSEGTGLRPLVERSCTQLIKIPGNPPLDNVMVGDDDGGDGVEVTGQEFKSFLAVESLNVSVAAGVMIHHLIGSNNSGDLGNNGAE